MTPIARRGLRSYEGTLAARRGIGAGAFVLVAVIGLVANAAYAAGEPAQPADAMKMPHPGMRLAPTTPMEKEMHALQAEIVRLRSEMARITATGDVAERRRLSGEHVADLRRTLTRFQAMELQMVDWVSKGRIVSDTDLRERQQLLAEQTGMLLQMLDQTIQVASGTCDEQPSTRRRQER